MPYFTNISTDQGVTYYDLKDLLPEYRKPNYPHKVVGLSSLDFIDPSDLYNGVDALLNTHWDVTKEEWRFFRLNGRDKRPFQGVLVFCNEFYFQYKLKFFLEANGFSKFNTRSIKHLLNNIKELHEIERYSHWMTERLSGSSSVQSDVFIKKGVYTL